PEDAGAFAALTADIEAQNRGRDRFRHPNVIAIFDVVAENGTTYLAMDRYPGQPLSALLAPGEALDRNEVDEILGPLLDGLAALHDDGLCHLDVCPGSLFIRRDGRPMLGRATLHPGAHRVEGRSFVLNEDEAYFAEEHFFAELPLGPWTDIYGLSATFYRLISGAPPANVVKRIKETARARPDPALAGLDGLRSHWHDDLLDTLARGLGIEAGDRWPSVELFRASLDGASGLRRPPANDRVLAKPVAPVAGDAAAPTPASLPDAGRDREEDAEDGPATVRVQREVIPRRPVEIEEILVQPSGRVVEPEVPSHPPLRLYRGGRMTVEPGAAPPRGAAPATATATAAAEAERLAPRFSLFAPERLSAGRWDQASLYLHEPGLETAVRRLQAGDPAQADPVRPRDAARIALGPGAPVSFVPETETVAVNPSRVTVAWHENIQRVDLRLQAVPGAAPVDETVDRLLCFVGPVLVGEIPLTVGETAGGEPAGGEIAGGALAQGRTTPGFTRVYLCAAEEDRAVLTAIDEAVRHLRMPFIGECAALRAKFDWDREIFRKIEQAEVFLLFWSEAAARSERIRKEWEFAANLDRDRFVRIVRLRAEAAAPPPDLAAVPRHRAQLV
ncbi:MAG: TIR domain-containing protein, partial [Bauldia litoralis]